MDPDQAQWQKDGQTVRTTITLECEADGSIRLASGDFSYEGNDPEEATQQFKRLIDHGRSQVQS